MQVLLVEAKVVSDLVIDGFSDLLGEAGVIRVITYQGTPKQRDLVWNRAVVRRIAAGQGDAFVKAVQGATAKTEASPRLPGRCSTDYEVDVFQAVGILRRQVAEGVLHKAENE